MRTGVFASITAGPLLTKRLFHRGLRRTPPEIARFLPEPRFELLVLDPSDPVALRCGGDIAAALSDYPVLSDGDYALLKHGPDA